MNYNIEALWINLGKTILNEKVSFQIWCIVLWIRKLKISNILLGIHIDVIDYQNHPTRFRIAIDMAWGRQEDKMENNIGNKSFGQIF